MTITKAPGEARRSIRYLAETVLRHGKLGSLEALLGKVVQLRPYKPYNALLLLLQRPGASFVLPAHKWEALYGYVIRPEEQPLVMLQPGGPVMFLFDVSQVEPGPEAQPLPPYLSDPYAMAPVPAASDALRWVIENAKLDGIRVTDAGLGIGYAGCATRANTAVTQEMRGLRRGEPPMRVPVHFDVLLNRTASDTEQLATLAHELGHIYCGHLGDQVSSLWPGKTFWKDRSRVPHAYKELEAESVARIVFKRLAPASSLPDHLSQYFATEPPIDAVDLEPVLVSAGRILEMATGFAPRRPGSRA